MSDNTRRAARSGRTAGTRRAERARQTRETSVRVALDLDGSGRADLATGVGFYDHLLTSLAHHSLIDIEVAASGDLHIDEHHIVEDVALCLGETLSEALGERAGIRRFGDAVVPMDEALARCALDLSGRPYAVLDLPFRGPMMGELSTQLVEHVLGSFAQAAGATLHLSAIGRNDHHLAEAAFKALARSLRVAVELESAPERGGLDQGIAAALGQDPAMTAPIAEVAGAPRVAVVDYGAGNLVSIRNALTLLGADVRLATHASDLVGADVILVPGVGASAPAMERLRRRGLVEPIRERVLAGTWYVGICLGMQILFERSDEDGARMLGLLDGNVVAIPRAPRLPHIGWNRLEKRGDHPVMAGLEDGMPAYFVHSYAPLPADPSVVVAETEHGGRFASLVATSRIVGFQFHPERSGRDGLRLLANVLGMVSAGRDPGSPDSARLVAAGAGAPDARVA